MPTTEDLIRKALQDRAATVDAGTLRYAAIQHDRAGEPQRRGAAGRARMLLAAAATIVVVAAIAIAAFALSGGNGDSHPGGGTAQPASESLYGITWLDSEADATVVFQPGTAHISDDCSGTTRVLTVSGQQLSRLGKQVGQSYTCSGAAIQPKPGQRGYAEYQRQQRALSRFYRVLESAPTWLIRGQQLTLTSPTGQTLTLTSKHTAPLTLPGSSWHLEQLVTPGRHQTGFAGPALTFDNHGGFRATDGSGDTLTGTATIDGNHITFVQDPSRYRGPRKHEISRAIDTILSGQLDYQIEHNTLRLYEPKGGAGELSYQPGP